jgi:hypothetical protein
MEVKSIDELLAEAAKDMEISFGEESPDKTNRPLTARTNLAGKADALESVLRTTRLKNTESTVELFN